MHLLVLPELAITGYGCEDEFFSMDTCQRAERAIVELLPDTVGIFTVFGAPIYLEGGLYNCAVAVKDGEIVGISEEKELGSRRSTL